MRKPVRYISMTEAEQKQLTSKYKFYAPKTIPVQKDVKGMTEPARSFAYDVFWLVHKKVSDDAIKAVGMKQCDPDRANAGWLNPETDSSATSLKS